MNNLDLHNKLLSLAKTVNALREKYPAAQHDLEQLIKDLHEESVVEPVHRPTPPPYRTS